MLMLACERNTKLMQEIIELLLVSGVDVNAKNNV